MRPSWISTDSTLGVDTTGWLRAVLCTRIEMTRLSAGTKTVTRVCLQRASGHVLKATTRTGRTQSPSTPSSSSISGSTAFITWRTTMAGRSDVVTLRFFTKRFCTALVAARVITACQAAHELHNNIADSPHGSVRSLGHATLDLRHSRPEAPNTAPPGFGALWRDVHCCGAVAAPWRPDRRFDHQGLTPGSSVRVRARMHGTTQNGTTCVIFPSDVGKVLRKLHHGHLVPGRAE